MSAFAIKIDQPEDHPKHAGLYVAEQLRHAADRVETQAIIEPTFIHYHPAGHVMYEWTTVFEPPPEPAPESRR